MVPNRHPLLYRYSPPNYPVKLLLVLLPQITPRITPPPHLTGFILRLPTPLLQPPVAAPVQLLLLR